MASIALENSTKIMLVYILSIELNPLGDLNQERLLRHEDDSCSDHFDVVVLDAPKRLTKSLGTPVWRARFKSWVSEREEYDSLVPVARINNLKFFKIQTFRPSPPHWRQRISKRLET